MVGRLQPPSEPGATYFSRSWHSALVVGRAVPAHAPVSLTASRESPCGSPETAVASRLPTTVDCLPHRYYATRPGTCARQPRTSAHFSRASVGYAVAQALMIGIGGRIAPPLLPHHRTYGSVYGGSIGYAIGPRPMKEVQTRRDRHSTGPGPEPGSGSHATGRNASQRFSPPTPWSSSTACRFTDY